MKRRIRAAAAALFVTMAAAGPVAAQSGQTIRIYYGFAAGSAGDLLSRVVAERMSATLGQSVVVENRVGASGRLAITSVKNAPPDGTAILITPNGPMAITPIADPSSGYDPVADFAPISQLVTFDFSVAVSADNPVRDIKDLPAWLTANPDKAAYGTPGAGTNLHFMAIAFSNAAKAPLRAVHYRGSAPALNDVVANQLPMMFTPLSDQIEQHRNGKVRILASAGEKRSPFTPDVPTFQERGFAVRAQGWYSAFTSAKTPPETIARLNKAMVEAINTPAAKERLTALAFETTGTSPEALAAALKQEIDYWRPVVKASGYRPGD